jgi:hypothetical protein
MTDGLVRVVAQADGSIQIKARAAAFAGKAQARTRWCADDEPNMKTLREIVDEPRGQRTHALGSQFSPSGSENQ